MRFIEHILSTIAPNECLSCGLEESLLCGACAAELATVAERCYRCLRNSPSFVTCKHCQPHSALSSVRPATIYRAEAKELVHKLKFERARSAVPSMAELIKIRIAIPAEAVISHVPTATSRIRQRGYDQAALIAKAVARQTGQTYIPLLARLGQQRQVGKNRNERHAQMKDLFAVLTSQPPRHVVLVDDVITTGATLEACANQLRIAGVGQVDAVVFAAA